MLPQFDRRALPQGALFSTWEAEDGWQLRRMDLAQPEGEAPRGSLIFAGGRGDFIEKYLEATLHWHAAGWHVTTFDWRGQGKSAGDIKRGHLASFDPMVADGTRLIEAWQDSLPGPHVAVGHSMGGHLLLRILAERRPALDAAVLVAPMIGINTAPIPSWLAPSIADASCAVGMAAWPAWRDGQPTGSFRQSALTASDDRYADELWWKEQDPAFELGPPTWGWLSAAFASIRRLESDLADPPTLPILLIGTERDRLVGADAIRAAAARLPAAELHMYPDAAHELLREADAVRLDAFARIDGFLDRHAAR